MNNKASNCIKASNCSHASAHRNVNVRIVRDEHAITYALYLQDPNNVMFTRSHPGSKDYADINRWAKKHLVDSHGVKHTPNGIIYEESTDTYVTLYLPDTRLRIFNNSTRTYRIVKEDDFPADVMRSAHRIGAVGEVLNIAKKFIIE